MARFELGINSTVTTTGAAAAEFRAPSGYPARFREVGLTLGAATASTYGFGRPAAIGVTPTSPITFVAVNPADSGAAQAMSSAVAWGTGPTAPTQFFRRITLPATIAAGVIWTWPPETLIVGPGNAAAGVASVVIWNLATNSASLNIYAAHE